MTTTPCPASTRKYIEHVAENLKFIATRIPPRKAGYECVRAADALLALLAEKEAAEGKLLAFKELLDTAERKREAAEKERDEARRDFLETWDDLGNTLSALDAEREKHVEDEFGQAHWHERAITAEAALAKAQKERDEAQLTVDADKGLIHHLQIALAVEREKVANAEHYAEDRNSAWGHECARHNAARAEADRLLKSEAVLIAERDSLAEDCKARRDEWVAVCRERDAALVDMNKLREALKTLHVAAKNMLLGVSIHNDRKVDKFTPIEGSVVAELSQASCAALEILMAGK